MPQIELAGNILEIDDQGYLVDASKWTEDIARAYAAKEGIGELTENHWKVINYLRGYFQANGMCPQIRRLTKDTGFSLKQIYDMFPEGPANSACKWSGMPKATGCA